MPIQAQVYPPRLPSEARSLVPWYLAFSISAGLGLLGKASLVGKFTHLPLAVVAPIALLFPCLPLLWPLALRFRALLGAASLLGLLGFSLVVFPHMDAVHKLGRGSDQAECVILAANRLATHQWPYVSALMSSHNAMSCGPGWVALQIPAIHWLGYRWDLALVWMVCAAVLTLRLGWSRTSGILALTALSGGTWMAAANGCDFLTFGIVLATLGTLIDALGTHETSGGAGRSTPGVGASAAVRWGLALVLGLVVQFRAVTLPVPVFFSRQLGRGAAMFAWALATACQLVFLLWNPTGFVNQGPLHLAQKLMRTSVLSTSPALAAVEFLLASLAGLGLTVALQRVAHREHPLLLYLAAVFAVPAAQNFIIRYREFGTVLRAFEFWEGGVWIGACVPLAALLLVLSRPLQNEAAEEPGALRRPLVGRAAVRT